jgi:hypothetical protein
MSDEGFRTRLGVLVVAFGALVLLSWPIVFSFDLWVLKDRGNLLNLDYLLDQHLRLGVDAYYIYGLLPVTLQRLAFEVAGRGYWPLLAFDALYMPAMAIFWAWFTGRTPQPRTWVWAAVVLSPILLWVNPNFPYVLVQLSLLFSLLLVYERRLSAALCVAVIGVFSVPSIPIVACALIGCLILLDWWQTPGRNFGALLRSVAPALVLAAVLAGVFIGIYGFGSLVASLLPLKGASFYRANHFGLFMRGSGLDFLYPLNAGWRYYLANRAGWWIFSTLVLTVFACIALLTSVQQRKLSPAAAVIGLCAVLHAVFAFFAYGPPPQHIIYDPLLAVGVLGGLAWLPLGAWRARIAVLFLGLGVLGSWGQIHETYSDWRETHISAQTAGLYAETAWTDEWIGVLRLASEHHVLFLSYGTGVHHYFPSLQSADSWTVERGQMLVPDMQRLLSKIAAVDIVIADLSGPALMVEADPQITHALQGFCLASTTPSFKMYWRKGGAGCGPVGPIS